VHWTFSDGNGNSSTANQTVIVKDATAPVAPVLANVTGECSATVTAPTTTDNCAGTVTGTTSDPLHLVAKAHVAYSIDGGPEQAKDVAASERTEITLPDGARIDARVAALDEHGNHLVELGSREVPIVIIGQGKAATVARPSPVPAAPRPTTVVAEAGARPFYLRWWPYAIGTAVFAGGAVYFGLEARSETDAIKTARSYDDARRAQDRGDRDALLTNVGIGVAGAFAITAGVMYFLAPHDHVERRISAVPLHGGGAIVFGGDL